MAKKKRKRRNKAEIQLDKMLKLKELGFDVSDVQIGILRQQVWASKGAHSRYICTKCKETMLLHVPATVECCGRKMKQTWVNPMWGVELAQPAGGVR